MTNWDRSLGGFKISDLISDNGVTFEIGEEIEEEEEIGFSPHVHFSNEEMLNMLNMNEFEDETEDNEKEIMSLYGMSFSKLKAKMTSITPDKKVMKFVKQKGIGEVVPCNAQITIHYIGYFEYRDEPFDSTYSTGNPRTLRLGQSCIISGLEIGINTMQKHEIAVFLIHPDLAYKAFGCPPRIPPNEEVVFVVQLLDYVDDGCASMYNDFDLEEKQSFENVLKPVSHMFVSAKSHATKYNHKLAIREYRKIIDCLETIRLKDNAEEEKMKKYLSRAYTNLAICHNHLNESRKACIACRKVPIPTAKSYFNFGKALLNLGEYDAAMKELQNAHALEPRDEVIKKAIQTANAKQREYLEIEKRLWKNCFKSKEDKTKITEFRKAARDLCETIINSDDITRQSLPEGLTKEEEEIVREEAAILGLNIVISNRYGKETVYLQKNKS